MSASPGNKTIGRKNESSVPAPTTGNRPSAPHWLPGGGAVLDEAGRILSANEALADWLGQDHARLLGQLLPSALGKFHPAWEKQLQEFLEHSQPFDRMELTAGAGDRLQIIGVEVCRHGRSRFVRMESVLPPRQDLEGLFSQEDWHRAVTHPVLNRLLRAEAQLANITRYWSGVVFSQRPDFSFIFASPQIEALTGIPENELRLSSRFWQVVHEDDIEPLQKRLKKIRESADGITSSYRVRNLRTGRISYIWEQRQAVYSSNGLLLSYEGIWLDITRQTFAERRLLSRSWMENLGTLSMGLTHDFCNIMTGIVSLSETFEREFADNKELCDGLRMIRTSAMQASQLSHRVRQLQLGKPGQKNYHDLNEIIASIGALLEKVMARRIKIHAVLEASQLPVYVDAVQLQQVTINLVLNAVDAMPAGGVLTLSTSRHAQAPSGKPLQGAYPRAPLVSVTVRDTGMGIPEQFLNSIFEPYFTTKPLGHGSGLGLYNARLFAESHNAAITVETSQQTGTAFHLWLAESNLTEADHLEASAPGKPMLLVVGSTDDNRARIMDLLRANQFRAVSAASMQEAFETLQSPDYQLNAVLLLTQHAIGEELSLLRQIRSEKLPIKIFLSPLGCNEDEFNSSTLVNVDATLPQEMPAEEFVARLKSFFTA